MKFNIDDYKGEYAMHCKTEEEAKDFLRHLHDLGRTWWTGNEYIKQTCWNYHKEKTVYVFNRSTFTDVKYATLQKYTILEWEDFMKHTFTKADLKTGDVVTKRNGQVEIVNRNLEMLICKSGFNDLDDLCDDLTSKDGKNYDIVEVRRPTRKNQCTFAGNMGTLVYERQEVEEMTLEQVCKLLGKEIKTIK